jgi:malate dehydrogenase (quinone)
MLEILQRCLPDRLASQAWQQRLQALLPSYGQDLNADRELLQRSRDRSDALLGLQIAR